MNSNKLNNFKILCIDGGGMKGLYSARILERIETQLQIDNNNKELRLSDYFDLICGTSAGGIIGLAISQRKPMRQICEFFENEGPKIFKKTNSLNKIKQIFFSSKHDGVRLREAILDFFKGSKIQEASNCLCIPSYNITHDTYFVFRFNPYSIDRNRDNNINYYDIALCTSAAPTYLPVHQLNYENINANFIDGGVWANNPNLVAIYEASKFVGPEKKFTGISLLSIPSLDISKPTKLSISRKKSIINWGSGLFHIMMKGQSEFSALFTKTILTNMFQNSKYYRIPTVPLFKGQSQYIDIDNASKNSTELYNSLAKDTFLTIKNVPEFKSFFETFKSNF